MTELRMLSMGLFSSEAPLVLLPTRQAALPCLLPGIHSPQPMFSELHHVIPQAWQRVVQREAPEWAVNWIYDNDSLFDARTDPLCPTTHGNVHRWIVTLMHWLADAYAAVPDPINGVQVEIAVTAVKREKRMQVGSVRHAEFLEGAEALRRFTLKGGDLRFLIDRKQWGAA